MRLIGFLGGTFDPVHYGHLRIGLELWQELQLNELRYVPCADPPHKAMTSANAGQRVEMLRLALEPVNDFVLDERELLRRGPSYSVDTLRSIREEVGPDTSVCWIIGSDSFQNLDTWHEWQSLFEFAHIIVACRPGWKQDQKSEMGKLLEDRFIDDPLKLQQTCAGYILPWQVTQLSISATAIRGMLKKGQSPRFLLPDSVLHYIERERLYRH